MKTQKLSFSAISGVMSRSEMKKIMAGSGDVCNLASCTSDADCGSIQGRACKCKQQGTYKACV